MSIPPGPSAYGIKVMRGEVAIGDPPRIGKPNILKLKFHRVFVGGKKHIVVKAK